MAYTTAQLTGTYKTFDDQPASGVVEIIPNSRSLVDAEGDVILAGRVKVALDEAGSFSVTLPATDDATVEPATGRQYTVVAKLRHTHLAAVTGVELATGATVDVADVASAPVVDPAVSLAATTAQLDALEADVDAALALKADADDVTAALAGKQDAGDYATATDLTTGLAGKADTADLAPVATTGAYTDLTGQPAIPAAPEDVGAEPAGLSAATEAALSATYGQVYGVAGRTGTSADTATIQARIDDATTAGGGTVVIQEPGTWVLNAALVLPSDTHLILRGGVTLQRDPAYLGNLITNDKAANPAVASSTGAMTSGDATLTVAESVFDASHVGLSVKVVGARYHATIVSVTSPTEVELSGAATATVSGAVVRVYERDQNISLTFEPGAILEGGDNSAATGTGLPHIRFRGVDGVHTKGVRVTSTGGKYALHFYACTDFTADDTWFNVSSDGIHVSGTSSSGRISGVFGTTSDDSVALTSTEYENYMDADMGNMHDILIERVYTNNAVVGDGVGTGNTVKVLPGSADGVGHTVYNITVRDIQGSTSTVLTNAVFLGGDTADPLTVGGTLSNILVENAVNLGTADSVGLLKQTTFRDVVLRRIGMPATSAGRAVFISNGAVIKQLTISECDWAPTYTNVYPVKLDPTLGACTIDTIRFVSCRLALPTKTGGLIHTGQTGHTVKRIEYRGYRCDKAVWSLGAFYHTAAQTTLHISGTSIAAAADAGMFYMASAAVNILVAEAGFTTTTAPVASLTSSGGALRSRTLGFPVDVSLLSRTNNDMAYNTNAALSCGEGPVVCTGGLWKHLGSGATY